MFFQKQKQVRQWKNIHTTSVILHLLTVTTRTFCLDRAACLTIDTTSAMELGMKRPFGALQRTILSKEV